MNIFSVMQTITLATGYLLLNDNQYKRRKHKLVKVEDGVNELNLTDSEFKFLKPENESNKLGCYVLLGSTQFKAGEKLGYDGEIPKIMATMVEFSNETKDESNYDEELVAAIGLLDKDNPEHWTRSRKPEVSILAGLLDRKVTAKQRDVAFNVHLEKVSDGS